MMSFKVTRIQILLPSRFTHSFRNLKNILLRTYYRLITWKFSFSSTIRVKWAFVVEEVSYRRGTKLLLNYYILQHIFSLFWRATIKMPRYLWFSLNVKIPTPIYWHHCMSVIGGIDWYSIYFDYRCRRFRRLYKIRRIFVACSASGYYSKHQLISPFRCKTVLKLS